MYDVEGYVLMIICLLVFRSKLDMRFMFHFLTFTRTLCLLLRMCFMMLIHVNAVNTSLSSCFALARVLFMVFRSL